MIHYPVIRFVIGSNALIASLKTRCVLMQMCHYTTTANTQCRCSIVFATAAVGAVGSDSGRLMDAAATVLMLVAMLSTFASARKPFKSKLIFGKSHKVIYMVRRVGFEPTTLSRDRIMSPGPATNTASVAMKLLYDILRL